MSRELNVAVAGATGAVGTEFLRLLEQREFPVRNLKLLASPRSAGKRTPYRGENLTVEALDDRSFSNVDVAFFSAGAAFSQKFASAATDAGAMVIDNSSAFRMDPAVPLIIPEINAGDLESHSGIVAVPNCTTIVALMALYPLHRVFGLRRVIAASYQAVSGAGAKGIEELASQITASSAGRDLDHKVFPHPIAFNVLPHIDVFLENGYTKEETKFLDESRKILHHADLRASITCVRVPVYRAHSVAINAEFERPVSLGEARDCLAKFPGLELVDDGRKDLYPMPLTCAGKDNCQVGRLRLDTALDNGLAFWVCGDQLRKGAALNAIQIAEAMATGSTSLV
jgi:aspartate-semialdehyde dehydrogenase